MCFTKYKRKKASGKKKNKVYPSQKYTPEFTVEEIIQCAGCSKSYQLDEIKIHCAGCDQFYHCKIAGTCCGDKCMQTINNKIHRLSYCTNCVPKLPINNEKKDRSDICICKGCYF